ncbi:tetratricopeptide repeat protein [Polaribacter sp. IC073]|uniref:tetratricopeptide repeat protein n=1 Tax=Polaribacter sp. IC073 TaxID=2508540 RepID=UPI0011BF1C79|nr:tetratricopeptide repeat protein [Polaribacter sp. IC073]TXD47226.1 tetratricopeptide repeat protein [Polaribacter sp. IC073]
MGTLTNNYIFKALENYPYDLEEVMEALNYALSSDDKNTMALTLMGRVYSEKLYKYEEAIVYFKQALAENVHAFEVYTPYINTLLWNEDYKEAEEFIDFGLTVKGSDKAVLYLKKANLYEQLNDYKKALVFIKLAKEFTFNSEYMADINIEKDRIKGKMPKKKKKAKASKKVKKSKE